MTHSARKVLQWRLVMPECRWQRWLVGAAIGLYLGGGFAWSREAKPDQQSWPPQQTAAEDQRRTKQSSEPQAITPAPSQAIGEEKPADDGQGNTGKKWRENLIEHAPDWSVAFFTFVLSVFTGLLWRSTNKLWLAGERQMELIQKNAAQQSVDMQASTSAAVRSAELAERAINENRAHSERELRAYVFPASCNIGFSETYEPIVTMEVKNFGQTPAYDCTTWISIWVEEFPMPDHVILQPPPPEFPLSKGSLAPGSHYDFRHKRELAIRESERELVREGTAAVYAYGCINYTDCYGRPQNTKIKHFFKGDECTPSKRGRMSQYMDGNEAT